MVVKATGETARAKKPPPPFYGKEDRRFLRAMYPSDTPDPLPDAFFQLPQFVYVNDAITAWFDGRDDVVVGGDNFVYYMDGDKRANLAPDCFVAIGVNKAEVLADNSYFVWRAGKMLDFVMEIGSRSTAENDLGDKYRTYESLGVGEYWLLDPSGGEFYGKPLMGFVNVDGAFVPIPVSEGATGEVMGYCEILDLVFLWNPERNEFRISDPRTGKRLVTYVEYRERAESEAAARAESDRARARTEDALTASEASRIESELALAQSEAIRRQAEERERSERVARLQAEARAREESERARQASERLRAEESARADAEAEVERLRAALRDIQRGN